MLQSITTDEIAALRKKAGDPLNNVFIPSFAAGTLIRVITDSGNCYFFEITDPKGCRAHVVRCEARPSTPNTGYRGERTVSETFEIGKQIDHYNSERTAWTGPVTEIHKLTA